MISTGLHAASESWHHGRMAKKSVPKRDFMQVGRAIVEQAVGEQMDGSELPPEAGISNHVWSIAELCSLLPQAHSATNQIDKNLVLAALAK